MAETNSRAALLEWCNNLLGLNLASPQAVRAPRCAPPSECAALGARLPPGLTRPPSAQLSNGAVPCQILHAIHPSVVPLHKARGLRVRRAYAPIP